MAKSEPEIKIIYIVSTARSGSTLLDLSLSGHPQILSVGEAFQFPSALSAGDRACSCQRPFHECPIWSGFVERWQAESGDSDPRGYRALVKRYGAWQRWFRDVDSHDREFGRFRAGALAFYRLLQERSGRPVIADSSKSPSHALALSHLPGIDVRVIHLVRDVRGVVWSFEKTEQIRRKRGEHAQPGIFIARAAAWVFKNVAANRVRAKLGPQKSILIRYEDFVTNPAAALSQIGQVTGLDFAAVIEAIQTGALRNESHAAWGNPNRLGDERLTLRLDTEWQMALPPSVQRITMALCGWLMKRYGY